MLTMGAVTCASEQPAPPDEGEMTLSLSSVFKEGERISTEYTCDGQDISPPLAWSEPPLGTQSFALVLYDLDSPRGVFTHWVLFDLPADSRGLPEAVPPQAELASGGLQVKNDFGKTGYGGPCPPAGHSDRYRFTIYALDRPLDLTATASKKEVFDAMRGHILARGQLTGMYQR